MPVAEPAGVVTVTVTTPAVPHVGAVAVTMLVLLTLALPLLVAPDVVPQLKVTVVAGLLLPANWPDTKLVPVMVTAVATVVRPCWGPTAVTEGPPGT